MPSYDQDMAFFQAGTAELPDYLHAKEIFWPLTSGRADLPRLTIGGLLLARARLRARSVSLSDQARLAAPETMLDAVRCEQRAAWQAMAGREARARFGLWRSYLEDYRQSPASQGPAYSNEVQWRVLLHLLSAEIATPAPELTALPGLDLALEVLLLPGGFVWEADLAPVFPADTYWYLYGSLPDHP